MREEIREPIRRARRTQLPFPCPYPNHSDRLQLSLHRYEQHGDHRGDSCTLDGCGLDETLCYDVGTGTIKGKQNTRLEKSKAGGIYQMTPYIMGKPDLDHRYASGSLQDLIWLLVSLFILSCCGIAGCLIQNRVTSYWKRIVPIGLTMLFDVSFSDT